jgi:transcriptional regulator with XRE-family HTH domain
MGRPEFDKATGGRVGAVIRERLKALSLSSSDLARRAQFDPSQMSKIALGKGGTDLAGWKRIAVALDLAPADFFARLFPPERVPVRRRSRRPSQQPRKSS